MQQAQTTSRAVIHTAAAIDALPWVRFDGLDDVQSVLKEGATHGPGAGHRSV